MKFLVTGCTSYMARYLIKGLLEENNNVTGISRSNPNIKSDKFKWIGHDLSIGPCEINERVDFIVHMAAQSLLNQSAEEYIRKNIFVTYNTAKMAAKLRPLAVIYTSSIKVYGEIRSDIVTENTDFINPDLYGVTKFLGEKILEETISTISLRMPGVISAGSHGWIDKIYRSLKADEPLSIFNSPYNHVIHSADILGFVKAISKMNIITSQCYNICAEGLTTSLDVVKQMSELLGSASKIEIADSGNKVTHVISNKKLLNIYKPLSVSDSIQLYVREMKPGEE